MASSPVVLNFASRSVQLSLVAANAQGREAKERLNMSHPFASHEGEVLRTVRATSVSGKVDGMMGKKQKRPVGRFKYDFLAERAGFEPAEGY